MEYKDYLILKKSPENSFNLNNIVYCLLNYIYKTNCLILIKSDSNSIIARGFVIAELKNAMFPRASALQQTRFIDTCTNRQIIFDTNV